jgi:hypothetical protein
MGTVLFMPREDNFLLLLNLSMATRSSMLSYLWLDNYCTYDNTLLFIGIQVTDNTIR